MIRRLAVLLAACCFPLAGMAQAEAPAREVTLAATRALVFETAGATPEADLPMVIGLHWSGARPEQLQDWFEAIDVPVRVVLPQGSFPRREGHSWFDSDYGNAGATGQAAAEAAAVARLSAFAEQAAARFPTSGRPFVAGVSYGGDLALLLALRHPRQVAAAFPIAARFLARWQTPAPACAGGAPAIRFMHGEKDATVPAEPTRRGAMRLRAGGCDVAFRAYPGVAHDFAPEMRRDFNADLRRAIGAH